MKTAEDLRVMQLLEKCAREMETLNNYMREREQRINLMLKPRVITFVAADVGAWKQILDANQYRYGFYPVVTTGAGVVYVSTQAMPISTAGLPISTTRNYPTQLDKHQGEVWVNPDAATPVLIVVEWVSTPYTPAKFNAQR